ncbi:DUF397 domain-containing protein [Streptomyces sp. DT24]
MEIAEGFPGLMPVRDSKRPDGPAIVFGTAGWVSFVAAVRRGAIPRS